MLKENGNKDLKANGYYFGETIKYIHFGENMVIIFLTNMNLLESSIAIILVFCMNMK
jgi:hypothetical protein